MIPNKQKFKYASLTAGISLLIMTAAAAFAYGYVYNSLIVDENLLTLNNLTEQQNLFQMSIICWFIIVVMDLLVSFAFYVILSPIHKTIAQVASGLRVFYSVFLAVAIFQLMHVSQTITNISDVTLLISSSAIMTSLNHFESIWSLGLIVFGAHLIVTGYLVFQLKPVPKTIAILLVIAGISYMFLHILNGFLPQYDTFTKTFEMVLSLPMMIGELSFGLWLLIKGTHEKTNITYSDEHLLQKLS